MMALRLEFSELGKGSTFVLRLPPTSGAHAATLVSSAATLEGIYAAVTRRTLDGANPAGWYPEQKITVEEALRAHFGAEVRGRS